MKRQKRKEQPVGVTWSDFVGSARALMVVDEVGEPCRREMNEHFDLSFKLPDRQRIGHTRGLALAACATTTHRVCGATTQRLRYQRRTVEIMFRVLTRLRPPSLIPFGIIHNKGSQLPTLLLGLANHPLT